VAYVAAVLFFVKGPPPTEIYPLSLHDALPISRAARRRNDRRRSATPAPRTSPAPHPAPSIPSRGRRPPRSCGGSDRPGARRRSRSEEHTSELQSPCNLVCRLLLEKKKNISTRN